MSACENPHSCDQRRVSDIGGKPVRITRCIAERSGIFHNREIEFSPGITVIYGTNGSGKSLLASALIDLVWENIHGSANPQLWNNFFLSASLEIDNNEYIFERNALSSFLIKEKGSGFENELLSFHSAGSGNSNTGSSDPLPYLASSVIGRYLRRYSSETFRVSSFLNSPLDGAVSISYDSLRKYFTDDATFFNHAFDSFTHSDNETINHSSLRTFTETILDHESELKKIDKEIQIINLSASRAQKLGEEIRQTDSEINNLRITKNDLEGIRERLLKIQSTDDEQKIIEQRISSIEEEISSEKFKISSFKKAKDSLQKIFPKFTNFTETQKENLLRIQQTYRKIKDAHDDLERALSRRERYKKSFHNLSLFCGSLFLVSSAVLYGSQIRLLTSHTRFIIETALASGFIILEITAFLAYRSRSAKIPVKDFKEAMETHEIELKNILRENSVIIEGLSAHETFEFLLQYFEEYGSFSEQDDETQKLEDSLQDDQYFGEKNSELKKLKKQFSETESSIQKERDEIRGLPSSEESDDIQSILLSIIKQINTVDENIEQLDDMRLKLTTEIDRGETPVDDLELFKKREAIEARLRKFYSLEKTLTFAVSLMNETIERREKRMLNQCITNALTLFHELSAKRHLTVIGEDILRDFLTSSTAHQNASVGHMLLLSVKLALTRFMEEENAVVPLILDEPTAYMDGERIKKFIEIIREFSEKRQIIIFTHDSSPFDGLETVIHL
jgi:energy-coupling factor transporter ATP-binding protein EcfA2